MTSLITGYLGQGLAADRPATPDVPTGALAWYFATDTEVLSLWDQNDAAWEAMPSLGDIPADFIDLDDVPTAYSGKEGYILRVKEDGTGIEFIPPSTATPPAPGETPTDGGTAITYATAAKWRVRTITPGSGGGVCIGEVILCDQNLAPQAVTSTDKSTEDATFTAAKAFDGIQAVGNGWKPSAGNEANSWVSGEMAAPAEIRYVKLRVSPGLHASMPVDFAIDYDDSGWVNVGVYNYAWSGSDSVVGFWVGVAPGSTPVTDGGGADDTAYGPSWNGNTSPPSKNAVYDKIETLQPLDADLTAIAALSTTSFGRAVLALADAAAGATYFGVGTGDSPQFTAINLGHASDTTLTRTGAGDIAVEGNAVYRAGGTDVPVADGGTGSSTAGGAATNLGLGTGDSPQFTAVNIGHASDTTLARASAGNLTVEGNALYRAGGTDVPVADGGTGSSTVGGAQTNLGFTTLTAAAYTALGSKDADTYYFTY